MTAINRRLLCVLATVCVTVLLPLGAAAPQPADAKKPTASAAKKARKKKRAASKRATAAPEKGPKGDKGDKGDRGETGPAGPAGGSTSSIVARARLTKATSTGDSGEVTLPLSGNTWTAAPDQADDLAGSVTVTVPRECDPPEDPGPLAFLPPPLGGESWPGWTEIGVFIDKKFVAHGFVEWSEDRAGKSATVPVSSHGRTVNGETPTQHTLELRAYDDCGGDGQSFEITDARVNVYAMR